MTDLTLVPPTYTPPSECRQIAKETGSADANSLSGYPGDLEEGETLSLYDLWCRRAREVARELGLCVCAKHSGGE